MLLKETKQRLVYLFALAYHFWYPLWCRAAQLPPYSLCRASLHTRPGAPPTGRLFIVSDCVLLHPIRKCCLSLFSYFLSSFLPPSLHSLSVFHFHTVSFFCLILLCHTYGLEDVTFVALIVINIIHVETLKKLFNIKDCWLWSSVQNTLCRYLSANTHTHTRTHFQHVLLYIFFGDVEEPW